MSRGVPYRDDDDARHERVVWLERALAGERSERPRFESVRVALLATVNALMIARVSSDVPKRPPSIDAHHHVAFVGLRVLADGNAMPLEPETP